MTKFIAVSNRRGGVGKTTTTMMLAYGLAVQGFQNVLVIDLDGQASTSITMLGHERWKLARDRQRTVGELFVEMHGDGSVDVAPYISNHVGDVHITPGNRRPNLSAIASSFELDQHELSILYMPAHQRPNLDQVFAGLQESVAQVLRALAGHFDVVVIDCPPGLSNIAWGALRASDYVLVPYIPDATAQDNVGWFVNEIKRIDPDKHVRVLANRVRANDKFQAGIMESIHDIYPSLGMVMPMRAAIAGALEFRTHSQTMRNKFGDGAFVVDGLVKHCVKWFEDEPPKSRTELVPASPPEKLESDQDIPSETISLEELQDEEMAEYSKAMAEGYDR